MSPTKNKRSVIWFIPKSDLESIVSRSKTINEVLLHFSLSNKGGNYKTLQNRLLADGISFSHIPTGRDSNKNRKISLGLRPKIDLNLILVKNSTYNRSHLKKRLLANDLLKNECSECGQLPSWNGKNLVLQLDHINGISDDNRLENLRFICPNCHSQTINFAGKNKKYKKSDI